MSKQKTDGSVIIDVEADLSKFNASLSKIAKAGTVALGAIGVSAGLLIKQVVDVGVSFESAFAGVKKTVNASTEELEGFRKEILNLSTDIPQTANEIANIAEAAGQLGIKNDALMGFTRTMADLGVATNMGATEAATTLARFANITQMSQKDFDRLGSTIVELGNNLATTEAEIADMALNIAGAGHQVGMSEPQILALSAALSSVGIEAAAGGTAMSTLMIDIKKATVLGGKDLQNFANVANMSAKDFKDAFEKDAGKAIQTFIEGLGSASEVGVDAISLLNDAGLTDVRMTRALLNAANASDVFSSSFDLANKAWDENIALTKEAEQRYETTEAKMQILNNTIAKAGITAFEKFKEPFKEALDTGISSVNELTDSLENGRLGQSVDNVAKSFSDLVSTIIKIGTKALPPLIDGLSWILDHGDMIVASIIAYNIATKGMLIITKVTGAVQLFNVQMALASKTTVLTGKALVMYTLKGNIAAKASTLLAGGMSSVALIAGGIAVAGIAALTVGLMKYEKKVNESFYALKDKKKALDESAKAMDELNKKTKESYSLMNDEINSQQRHLSELLKNVDATGKYNGEKDRALYLIKQLNDAYPDLNLNYNEESGLITTQNGLLKDNVQLIQEMINSKRVQAYLDSGYEEYTEAIKGRNEAIKDLTNSQLELDELEAKKKDAPNSNMTEAEYKRLNFLKGEYIPGLEQTIDKNNKLALSYENVSTTAETNMLAALNLINGMDLILYDPTKGEEQITGLQNQVTTIEDTIKKLEETKIEHPEWANAIDERLIALKDNLATANIELEEAQIEHNAKMEELATNAGLDEATAYTTEYKEKADTGMAETGLSSAKAFETTSTNHIKCISFPEKEVIIRAKYVGFEGPGGVSTGAFGGSSYDDTQDPYPIIQPNYSRMVDMAKNVVGSIQNKVARNVSLGNSKLQIETGGGNSTKISQVNNFNQPIEKPSQVTRAIEKASRDLKKAK